MGDTVPAKVEYNFIMENVVEASGQRPWRDPTSSSTSVTAPSNSFSNSSRRSSISPKRSGWTDTEASASVVTPASSVCSDISETDNPKFYHPPLVLSEAMDLDCDAISVVDLTCPDRCPSYFSGQNGSAQDVHPSQNGSTYIDASTSLTASFITDPLSDLPNAIPSSQTRYANDDTGGATHQPWGEICLQASGHVHPGTPDLILPEGQYIVERILSHEVERPKGRKKEIVQYFVKWEGYPDEDSSFVDKIHEYHMKAYTATAEKIIEKRVRPGKRKKAVTQYLVAWRGYPHDQGIWINKDNIDEDLVAAYRRATEAA